MKWSAREPKVQPEQILAVTRSIDGGFCLEGARCAHVPYGSLGRAHLYAVGEGVLEAMAIDAAAAGFCILEGRGSARRGLQSLTIGVGALGHRGRVHVRTSRAWCLESELPEPPEDADEDPRWSERAETEAERIQRALRSLCARLNMEETTFCPSAHHWLEGIYKEKCAGHEPEESGPLPIEAEKMARRAHVGGPVIHARTTLEPFISLDRTRAFGQAILGGLPGGLPSSIPLRGKGLDRWRPHDLMRSMALLDAVVEVHENDACPLLPLHHPQARYAHSRTLYPTGTFSGTWCSHELAALEQEGRGKVTRIDRALAFEITHALDGAIEEIRRLEPFFPFPAKRLEHLLYGKCATSLVSERITSGPSGRTPLLRDVLDDRALRGVAGRPVLKKMGKASKKEGEQPRQVPWSLQANLAVGNGRGGLDRPDRAAWITASNRVELGKILGRLDKALGARRPGDYVGRIYVDGLDIEAPVEKLPTMKGMTVKAHGPKMHVYRSLALSATLADGKDVVEGGNLLPLGGSRDDLVRVLRRCPSAEHGPFAEGRTWPATAALDDPRLAENVRSAPLHIDLQFARELGFCTWEDETRKN